MTMTSDDFLYIEDNKVMVSDIAMQIPEFKDFKRYDNSTNKVYFYSAMSYIFYVYKVFGENRSYLYNLSLPQRKMQAVQRHTGSYKEVTDFDGNKWVDKCIDAYMRYSRTRSEVLFDALKEDIDKFMEYVYNIPHTIKQHRTTRVKQLDGKGDSIERVMDVEIEIANTKERIEALKQAKDLNDLYKSILNDVMKDHKIKKINARRFEDPTEVNKINIPEGEFPISAE